MSIDINRLWLEKIEQVSGKIKAMTKGNDDYYQEGILGTRKALLKDPHAPESHLITAAKGSILHYREKGVSIDNGSRKAQTRKLADGTLRTYQKRMVAVHDWEVPDYSFSPDVLAIDKICAEKFYRSLNEEETEFIRACIKSLNGRFFHLHAMRLLGIGWRKYRRIRRATYRKFIRAFGTDEEIERLNRERRYAR